MPLFNINHIYQMDCLDYLGLVPNEAIDLVVVDPPYNMKKADWDSFVSHDAFLEFSFNWLDKVIEKLKPTGSLYVFNTPFNSSYFLSYLVSRGLVFQNWIVWDKRDGLGATKNRFVSSQETILFFTKSKKHTFNADAVRMPYDSEQRILAAQTKGIIKNGKRWFPNPNGKLCGEIWHFSSHRHKNKVNGKVVRQSHITPKPHDLIERIIKASSNSGDLVLDCFMGSGTTAVVAKKLNRNFTGCEINVEYHEIAVANVSGVLNV